MIAAEQIIDEALAHDVVLYLKEGRLAYTASNKSLPDSLKRKIDEHKESVIEYLQKLDRAQKAQELRAPMILPRSVHERPPISFAQQRLWFLAQLEGVSATYHLPAALHLRGALDRRALCRALNTVLARHEGLRSVFVAVDGEPQVRLLPETTGLPLIEHDLRGHENASVELARLSKEEARAPFDLAQGPLIRSRLVQLADDDHVLLLTQHHIVSDGWSIGVLSRELTTLYQAFQQGQANPLPPLTIQYPDYAAWQRGWLSGERLERQTAYWREALTGAPALLELPTDRPRPAQPDHSGARVPIVLDAELTRSLKQLSQRHGTTLFMTVLAAWAVVLSRLSGQDEVVIGTPTANRGRVETEGLIGFFVNTLALRIQLDESPSVSELLSRARKTALAAQEHQDLSFEQVVEIVQPPRRLNQNPIFQVLFNWDEDRTSLPSSGSVAVAPMAMPYEVSRFDLKLNLTERDGSLQGIFLYAPALFDAATIERQVGYLQAVLRAMAADSEQSVAAIELLSEDERRLQLETWNATAAEYPQDRCIHELFEEQARNSPEAPAVVHEDRVLSYGELNAQANRLAHYLMGQGVGPDDRVAICVERSAALVIGLLAILKAGAAYVPLDPAYPSGRLSQIVGDSAPSLLLIDAAGRAALGEAPCEACMVVDLEPLRQGEASATAWSSQPVENPQVAGLTARHLAYVIYTSGSTGTPKGVMVEHHSLVNFHEAVKRDIYRSGARLRIGWNASFSFDMSMKGFLQLLIGHALVIIPQDVRATSAGFLRFLDEQAIDGFDITPSLLKALIGEGLLEEQHRRTVLVGGEPIDAVLWQQLQSCRTIEFHNMYGPTECTVDATMSVIGSDDAIAHIGRPIANTRIYLLDEQRQPALLGATGELYIGGDGVARGYFNRPELTAERFLKDPFSPHPEARMYRTGDLARYLPDGNIEYLGRNDFQVKIRGFRIELGEIEARLSQHALVREAVVEARDAGEEKRLAAYVIPAEETIETDELVAALRAYLATTLPDYMVPSAFVRMAAWPLTPNGKLDRKALPAPDDEAYARREYEAPQGEIEQTLAGLWRELLRVERIGRQDDFFELGGHSLLAVRLLVHIRQSLGADLPVVALFAQPTLAGLAQAVIEAGAGRAKEAVLPMARISRDEPMPLSFAQQRLWFLAQLEGVSATYHIPLALRLRGALDRAALCRALDTVLARHEGLRSVFVAVDGEPQVRLLPETTGLPLIEHDLRGHENASVELARLGKEEARAPFDLAQGPLIRSRLVQLADDDHVLLLTQHHIVSDGWSIGVLSRELTTLYQAFQQGQANPLPPLTIQYPDYAAWQRGWLSGERLERQTAYWREALTGAPALLELPTDRPRPAQPDHSGARVPIVLDAELTRSLKQLSQRHGTTLFMTVLAAWAVVLSRLSGQDEVVIGTPTANRGRVETEGLIGFFVNTLALRIQLDESPSVSELLSRARKFALAAQEHQDLPFEQVVEIVQPPRRLDQNPIFQVLFNWRNNEVSLPEFAGVQVTLPVTGYEVLKFDLELSLSELNEQIVGSLAYATALFDATTIERHVGYLQAALRAMVSNSEQRVAAIELLSEEERRLQLETWNATAAEYPQDRCIHELFEEQVRKSPEARAVVHEDRVLSYSELNAQANRLAHYLIGLGVGPDDRVAICVERSAAMVIGLLAILKAGGAYVPLDPAYPSERLSQIVGDAAPSLLLIDAAGRAALGGAASSGWTLVDLEPLRQGEGSATAWSSQPAENAQVPGLTSRHLAYVIYTSGSTGTPKGVMNEHRALINRLLWMQQAYGLDSTDVVLQKTTFSFDVSVWEFFWTLQQGATLLVPAPELHKDPAGLIELMVRAGVTTAHFVPSMLDIFLMTRGVERCTALRRLICSGEALPAAYVQACREKLPGAQLHNLYGPTEAAVDVTAWTCPPSFAGGVVPIGRPIANTRIYLLDEQGQPALLGATGELYIGGDGVARGYFNRPELTAERFLKDPFSPHPEARMYRTGDLARYLPDGNIEYLGRNDFQVKIRGFRIELGEIEAQLSQHALVREAVVEARDAGEEKRLAAYVIPAEETIETDELVAALRAYLATTLPDYMVPSAFVRMAAWPLTPNGKLDRKALPAPDDEAYVRREYEAPQGEIEQTLAGLWRELLQIERIGRQDDFFELGGHSLTATRLLARIRQALGVELPVATVFARPTLMTLAQAVAEASATAQAVLPMARISREEPMPLSFAQQRLWFLAQLEGASQAYHMAYGIRLKGELKREALQQALGRLVARHEALRTTFVVVEGEPRQKITAVEESRFELLEQDLRQLGEEEREQRLAGLIQEEAQRRFDLEHGPLIRGRLIRLAEQEHGLLITMHHIVSDGWSMEVMMSEMSILYAAYGEGQGDPLPALEVQYGDYALWQREWMAGELMVEQAEYWKQTLGGAPEALELPTDHRRPEQQDYAGGMVEMELDEELTAAVKELSRRQGTTVYMTLLGSWAALLGRLSGQKEVVIGSPVANRGRVELEGLIGFLANTVATRVDLGGRPTVKQLLGRVKGQVLGAQANQDMPFEQVVEVVNPERSMSRQPLFQVMLAWQNTERARAEFAGLDVEPLPMAEHRVSKFDLTLYLREVGEKIVGKLEYATGLWERNTVERYGEYWRRLVAGMVAEEAAVVDSLAILSEEELEHAVIRVERHDRGVCEQAVCARAI